jgi:hypothetical protein
MTSSSSASNDLKDLFGWRVVCFFLGGHCSFNHEKADFHQCIAGLKKLLLWEMDCFCDREHLLPCQPA